MQEPWVWSTEIDWFGTAHFVCAQIKKGKEKINQAGELLWRNIH
jgi:hypothetical protein